MGSAKLSIERLFFLICECLFDPPAPGCKGERKKNSTFQRTCPLSSDPPPSASLADQKNKKGDFSPFFIPIEPECSEMDNFDKNKMGCGRPPRRDTCIQNIMYAPFISKSIFL